MSKNKVWKNQLQRFLKSPFTIPVIIFSTTLILNTAPINSFVTEISQDATVSGRTVFPDTTGAYAHVKFTNVTDPGEVYEFDTQQDGTFTFQTLNTNVVNDPVLGPTEFQVYQNYPNPVGDLTTIEFYTTVPGDVTVEVYNVLGQLVDKEVYSLEAGQHAVGYKPAGGAGIQFYRVTQPDGKSETKKLVTIDSFADGGLTGPAPASSSAYRMSKVMNGKTFNVEITSPDGEFQARTIDNVFIDGDVDLGNYFVNEIINGNQLYFDFNEDGSQTYSNDDITSPTGIKLISLEDVPPEIIAELVSGDSTRVAGNLDQYGSFEFTRKVTATHGTPAEFTAYVNINSQDDLRGLVEDHQFNVRRGGIINIDGTDYVIGEDGQFDHQVAPKDTHIVVARQYQGGQPYSFKRTIDVPGNGDNNDILIRPTDYTGLTVGDTSGVTPEEYKLWVREINSDPVGNCNYFGFKKPDLDSTVVWIAYNDESGSGSTFTRADQDTVEKYYRDVIFAQWLGREVPIYKEDPDNPEPNPYYVGVRNVQLVQPNNTIPGAGEVGVRDWDYDGEIDAGFIALRTIPWAGAKAIIQEGISGKGAIGFPINSLKKDETITHQGTIRLLPSVYDNKFGHMIGEATYLPKESVDRILGL